MQYGTVLHIAPRSNPDGIYVTSNDRVHPDTRLLTKNDVANNLSGRVDITTWRSNRPASVIASNHAADFTPHVQKFSDCGFPTRSRRKLPSIYVLFVVKGRILQISLLGLFGGVFFLAEVRVQEGEPLENALRRFKRKVQTEDIIKEVKRHSFYLKPGEKKRVKEALARKRNRKKVRKEQD
jgi:small subunit ribosomal protein S21